MLRCLENAMAAVSGRSSSRFAAMGDRAIKMAAAQAHTRVIRMPAITPKRPLSSAASALAPIAATPTNPSPATTGRHCGGAEIKIAEQYSAVAAAT